MNVIDKIVTNFIIKIKQSGEEAPRYGTENKAKL